MRKCIIFSANIPYHFEKTLFFCEKHRTSKNENCNAVPVFIFTDFPVVRPNVPCNGLKQPA